MMLIDAGPLVALVNKNDPKHVTCANTARGLANTRLITTWPCFTEAMHLVYKAGGYPGQVKLWQLFESDLLEFFDLDDEAISRMIALMKKYHDTPMDLADASLVAVAERLGLRRIFTLDSDFRVYRLADGSALDVVP